MLEQHRGVGDLEIVAGIFLLCLQEDIAVGDLLGAFAAVEVEIIDVVDALDIHRQTLEHRRSARLPRERIRCRRPAGNR
jgi:hypothetical protein